MDVTRRQFLKTTTTTAAALLAGVPGGWAGGVYAADGPEAPKVRIGIIALTDCSSLVMAHELGLFKKYGIESTISKEASWAVIRDRLTIGENQATHLLLGTAYAMTMGLQGSPQKPTIVPLYLNRNGQAITLTKALGDKGLKTPAQIKPLALEAKAKSSPMTFAMTYPPGTHAPSPTASASPRSPRSSSGATIPRKCSPSRKSSPRRIPRRSARPCARSSRRASGLTSSRTARAWPRSSRSPSTSTARRRSSTAACSATTTTATDGRRRTSTT